MSYIGNAPASFFTAVTSDVFSANGTANTFTLSKSISNLADIEVVVDNIQQNPFSGSYSVNGSSLTFSSTPSAGSNNIIVTYRQATIGSSIPTPNTVSNSSLQSNLLLTGNTSLGNTIFTGVATFSSGSSTAPAITTSGDTNTGIFFPAADTIAFAEGGAEAMRIDSSGNVGIGTSSPGAKLSLTSTGNTTADGVRLTFGSEARPHNIYSDLATGRDLLIAPWRAVTLKAGSGTTEGEVRLQSYESTIISTGSSYTERMRIDSSGNVGVGITPSAWRTSGGEKVIQFDTGSVYCNAGNDMYLNNNWYLNSSAQSIYIETDFATSYSQQNGQHIWYSAPSGTAGNTITFTIILQANRGQTLALEGASLQNGTGITFPATQSASTDANTLDDYEEGTFNPTVLGTGTAGTVTYGDRFGTYTKIGNKVFFTIYMTWSSGTGSGDLRFGNLPFTSANNSEYPTLAVYTNNVNYTSGNTVVCYLPPNGTTIEFRQSVPNSGAIGLPYDANVSGFIVSGHYTAA